MLVLTLLAMLKAAPGYRDTEMDLPLTLVALGVAGLLIGLFFLVNAFAKK